MGLGELGGGGAGGVLLHGELLLGDLALGLGDLLLRLLHLLVVLEGRALLLLDGLVDLRLGALAGLQRRLRGGDRCRGLRGVEAALLLADVTDARAAATDCWAR